MPIVPDTPVVETEEDKKAKQKRLDDFLVEKGNFTRSQSTFIPTVGELQNDEIFQDKVKVLANYFAENDSALGSIFTGTAIDGDYREFLRDGSYRLTSVIDRANALKDAPEYVKEAYKDVRQKWDSAELKGYGERVKFIKDFGVDVLTDPVNLISLLAIPFTSGASAAAGLAAKEGAKRVAINTLKNVAAGTTTKTAAVGGAISGGTWTGVDDYYQQQAELATGLLDEYNIGRNLTAAGIGAILGGGISGAATSYFGRKAARVDNNIVPENRQIANTIENADDPVNVIAPIVEGDAPYSETLVTGLEKLVDDMYVKNVNDWIELDKLAAKLAKDNNGGERTQEEIADALRQFIQSAKNKKLDREEVKEGLRNMVVAPEEAAIFKPNPANRQRVTKPMDEEMKRQFKAEGYTEAEIKEFEIYEDVSSVPTTEAAKAAGREANKILYRVGRTLNNLNSKTGVGRSTALLQSIRKYSPTAATLERRLQYDAPIGWTGSKIKAGEVLEADYSEVFREYNGSFVTNFKTIYEPLALNAKGQLGEDVNDVVLKALRTDEFPEGTHPLIKKATESIRKLFYQRGIKIGLEPEDMPENYVPRLWKRSVIEGRRGEFVEKLVSIGYTQKQASDITTSMLSKDSQIVLADSGPTSSIFLKPRVLSKITNDDLFADFLENDLNVIINEYGNQTSRRLAKLEVLGVTNQSEFETYWLKPIERELRENTDFSGKEIAANTKNVLDVYKSVTGENVERLSTGAQTLVDTYSLTTRMALLPLATVSSLTEVFINVAKSGFKNAGKGFAEASNNAFKTISTDMKNKLLKEGYTEPEIWKEMQSLGIAMDQAAADVTDRLSGEALANETMRKVSNKFFRANFLDQWTKFVQMSSYITGKNMITDNIEEIGKSVAAGLDPSKRIRNKMKELNELGISVNDAVNWYNGGMLQDDPFTKIIQRGAGRYTNEVILNPSAASGLKPLWQSNPRSAVLYQLLGYPAAFTNTVLKNAVSKLIDNPTGNVPKVFAAAYIMTETARFTNYARTNGASEEEGPAAAYGKALARWGGQGAYLDMFDRGRNSSEYYKRGAVDYLIPFFGPLASDAATLARTGNLAEFIFTKTPGYTAIRPVAGEEAFDDTRAFVREMDKRIKETLAPESEEEGRRAFAIGGEVDDVPQVPEEPDERIDKMTGLPYNEQAGGAFIDQEERYGFMTGSIAKVATKGSASIISKLDKALRNLKNPIPSESLPNYLKKQGVKNEEIEQADILKNITSSKIDKITPEVAEDLLSRRADAGKAGLLEQLTRDPKLVRTDSEVRSVLNNVQKVRNFVLEEFKEDIGDDSIGFAARASEIASRLARENKGSSPLTAVTEPFMGSFPYSAYELNELTDSNLIMKLIKKAYPDADLNERKAIVASMMSDQESYHSGMSDIILKAMRNNSKSENVDDVIKSIFNFENRERQEVDAAASEINLDDLYGEYTLPDTDFKSYAVRLYKDPRVKRSASHWSDKSDKIAFHTRTDVKGNTLRIQEIQSDFMNEKQRLERRGRNAWMEETFEQTKGSDIPYIRLALYEEIKQAYDQELDRIAIAISPKNVENLMRSDSVQKNYETRVLDTARKVAKQIGADTEIKGGWLYINLPKKEVELPRYNEGGFLMRLAKKLDKAGETYRKKYSVQQKVASMVGINPDDVEWANSLSKRYPQSEELDGRGDAARHLALGWLAQKSDNPKAAKFLINAREVINNIPEQRMDRFNNNLGFAMKAADRAEAEARITQLIDDEEASYMTPAQSRRMRRASGGFETGDLIHPENAKFFKAFHDSVLAENKQGRNEKGETVTMYITGVGYNGKEYLLPGFDPETGKATNDPKTLLKRWKYLIDNDIVKGYDNPDQADADRDTFYKRIIKRQRRMDGGKVMRACAA